MTTYGYARVSTAHQGKDGNSLEAQHDALRDAGATQLYTDTFTGIKMNRPEFTRLINTIQPGDTLIVTKLDRLARSASGGIELVDRLLNKGVKVYILNMGMMDSTPTGRLIRNVMFAFAEFERDMIVERTQEGKAIARTRPDFKEGRPSLPQATIDAIRYHYRLAAQNRPVKEHLSVQEFCNQYGISRSVYYKYAK